MSVPVRIQEFTRGIYNDSYAYFNVPNGSFSVDTSQLASVANSFSNAQQMYDDEVMQAMGYGILALDRSIISLMPGGASGQLKRSTRRLITRSGNSIEGEVRSLGSIAPHNVFVDLGHGPIRPRRKKWLHYFIGGIGGREVFSKYSPPAAPKHFMSGGLKQSEGAIIREFDLATGRLLLRLSRGAR